MPGLKHTNFKHTFFPTRKKETDFSQFITEQFIYFNLIFHTPFSVLVSAFSRDLSMFLRQRQSTNIELMCVPGIKYTIERHMIFCSKKLLFIII